MIGSSYRRSFLIWLSGEGTYRHDESYSSLPLALSCLFTDSTSIYCILTSGNIRAHASTEEKLVGTCLPCAFSSKFNIFSHFPLLFSDSLCFWAVCPSFVSGSLMHMLCEPKNWYNLQIQEIHSCHVLPNFWIPWIQVHSLEFSSIFYFWACQNTRHILFACENADVCVKFRYQQRKKFFTKWHDGPSFQVEREQMLKMRQIHWRLIRSSQKEKCGA